MEKFPNIKNQEVVLVRAEASTGVVLDEVFKYATNDTQKVYSIFLSKDEAINEIRKIIKDREGVECIIYDCNREMLLYYNPIDPESSINFELV